MAAGVSYVEAEAALPEVRGIYQRLRQATGRVLNFYRLLAHHPPSLATFAQWYPSLRDGPLDAGLRELAYVRASELNRCRYCATHHRAVARKAGVPREKLEALPDYESSPLFSDLEREVLRYADAMTTKVQVDPALVEALRRRVGPQVLVQLTLSIAAANFTNRLNEALGTELEVGQRAAPGEAPGPGSP